MRKLDVLKHEKMLLEKTFKHFPKCMIEGVLAFYQLEIDRIEKFGAENPEVYHQ